MMMLTCQLGPSHLPVPLTVSGCCVQSLVFTAQSAYILSQYSSQHQQLSSPLLIIAVITVLHTCLHVSCPLLRPRPGHSTVTPSSISISGHASLPRCPPVTSITPWRAIMTCVAWDTGVTVTLSDTGDTAPAPGATTATWVTCRTDTWGMTRDTITKLWNRDGINMTVLRQMSLKDWASVLAFKVVDGHSSSCHSSFSSGLFFIKLKISFFLFRYVLWSFEHCLIFAIS